MARFAGFLVASVVCVTLGGCELVVGARPGAPVVITPQRRGGPPAHAPAYGYRRKQHSEPQLRFDSNLGVYIVVGQTDVYFDDGLFLRFNGGSWQVSANLAGPWEPRAVESLPPGLRSKGHPRNARGRGHGRGHGGPARGDW